MKNRFQNRLVICFTFVLVYLPLAKGQRFTEWSVPVNLGSVVNADGSADFFACISKDGLSLYFTSTRSGGYGGWDIWVTQRTTVDSAWSSPTNLGPTVNTPYDDMAPTLSTDGHRMYFSSDRPGGFGGNDLYFAQRHNKRDDFGWQAAENLGSGVNTSANESSPTIFDDETGKVELYFDSNRAGGPGPFTDDPPAHNGNDIYSSTESDGTFGPAALVTELSSTFFDRQPSVRRDGLEIFFASNRTGTHGALDLWVSTRASTSSPWSTPINLAAVNSSIQDASPAISFDGTLLFLQSNRPNAGGLFHLFVATRTKLKGDTGTDADNDHP